MNRKTVAIVLIVLAAALLVYWAVSGAEYYTLQQVPEKTVDSLFNTETTVWKDEFRPGLLDLIGPAAGVLLLIAAVLFWLAARRKRAAAQ
jgi:hypothetical protein